MFDSIRSHRRWLMFFMLALIFPSFVFFGIQGYDRFLDRDDAVARVAGQPISRQEFEAAQRERLDRLRQMFGQNFDPKVFDSPQARAATLDSLLAERALAAEAIAANVSVSEERLREVITGVPAFQQDGKFSYERYKTLLAAQGQNELLFENRLRSDLVRQTLARAMAESSFVPRAVAERLRALSEEERSVRELRFRPEDFVKQVKVDDAAIEAYYQANRAEFEVPESVRAEYIVLSLDDVAATIGVPEADARAYYEQNKTRFGQDEQRRASHILFTAGDGGSAKDKDGARQLAEQTLKRVRGAPGDFAKLAKELSKDPGSAANGGDLGFFGRNMMVKSFEEAAFKLKEGEISDIVESDFGLHIIRVTGIKPAQIKPFDEVRAEIEGEYRRAQAQKKFAEAAELFSNTVYEQADSLAPVAEKLKLKVQAIDRLTRQGVPPAQGAPQIFNPRLVEAIFSADSLKNKRNTEAVEVAPTTLAAARVLEHRPATMRPLADVREAIRARVERQQASKLAREAGEQRLQALATAPSDAGFGAVRTISRNRPEGLPAAALKAIMQAAAEQLPRYVGAELDGGVYGVFSVLRAGAPEKPNAEQRQQAAGAWEQMLGAGADAAYLDVLKKNHKAEVLKTDLKRAAAEK